MDLEELRALVAVVEGGSFAAAADALGVSRATLRRRVQSLEARLQRPLVETTATGATPTATALALTVRSRRLLAEVEAVIQESQPGATARPPHLSIVVPNGSPQGLLAEFTGALRGLIDDIAVTVGFACSSGPTRDGHDDAVVHFGPPRSSTDRVGFQLLLLRERLLAHPAYLEQHGTPTSLSALTDHRLLLWRQDLRAPDELPLLDGQRRVVSPAVTTTSIELLRRLAARGDGIMFGPDGELPGEVVDDTALVPVLEDVVGGVVQVSISVARRVYELPALQPLWTLVDRFAAAI